MVGTKEVKSTCFKVVVLLLLLCMCYIYTSSTSNQVQGPVNTNLEKLRSVQTRSTTLILTDNQQSTDSTTKQPITKTTKGSIPTITSSSDIEIFEEVLHPGVLTAKGPRPNDVLNAKQASEKCSFVKDGWELTLMKGDCQIHLTNKEWLSKDVDVSKVRVLHLVKTMDKYLGTRVPAIKDTWAKRLRDINPENKVIFLKSGTASEDPEMPCITVTGGDDLFGLHKRVLDGLEIVYNRYANTTDWFNVVDDDIYIVPDLALRYLSQFDPTEPVLLAQLSRQKMKGECIPSAGGGGGMFISKAAIEIIINKTQCPREPGIDDFEISRCLLHAGVSPTCVQDPEGKVRLLSQNLLYVLKEGYKGTFRAGVFPRYDKISNPYGQDPFSTELITWNHNSPEDLYMYDFFLHRHLNKA